MSAFYQDLQYGLRGLMKQPGVTLIAVLSLAIGIGGNTAIFSVVNTVLLNPLPGIKEPHRLVRIIGGDPSDENNNRADAFTLSCERSLTRRVTNMCYGE